MKCTCMSMYTYMYVEIKESRKDVSDKEGREEKGGRYSAHEKSSNHACLGSGLFTPVVRRWPNKITLELPHFECIQQSSTRQLFVEQRLATPPHIILQTSHTPHMTIQTHSLPVGTRLVCSRPTSDTT